MRLRAFTLIEVTVALAMGALVLTAAVAVYASTLSGAARARARAAMARDGVALAHQMTHEIRQTGLGVPKGKNATKASSNEVFGSEFLAGEVDKLGILADFPRPDAQYNTFGFLNPSIRRKKVVGWHNENNGSCMPSSDTNFACSTATTSTFFPGEDGCDSTADAADRTCPWGMKRLGTNDHFMVVAGDGTWARNQVLGSPTMRDAGEHNTFLLNIANNWKGNVWDVPANPASEPGIGWVTTLDRVFYRHDPAARTVTRQQCWGDPVPDDAAWPRLTTTTVPVTPGPVGVDTICTRKEVVARNVQSLQFSYFDAGGTAIAAPVSAANKVLVRRVDFTITFRKAVNGKNVDHVVTGTVQLRNL